MYYSEDGFPYYYNIETKDWHWAPYDTDENETDGIALEEYVGEHHINNVAQDYSDTEESFVLSKLLNKENISIHNADDNFDFQYSNPYASSIKSLKPPKTPAKSPVPGASKHPFSQSNNNTNNKTPPRSNIRHPGSAIKTPVPPVTASKHRVDNVLFRSPGYLAFEQFLHSDDSEINLVRVYRFSKMLICVINNMFRQTK